MADSEERQAETAEAEEAESSEAAASEVSTDLDELVTELTRERDEYLELAQRARADFDNYRRRSARESEAAERRGKADLARAVLPAVDNLERALVAAGVDLSGGGESAPESREVSAHEALAAGVALVHGELTRALSAVGVESFDPRGESFDPSVHEALSTRPAADGEQANLVAETLQRGYRVGETLIRPARVVVTA